MTTWIENVEAPPWTADFRFSAVLDIFWSTFFWTLGGGFSTYRYYFFSLPSDNVQHDLQL